MLKCDICGSELLMNAGGQGAHCKLCGMNYGMDRLREKLGTTAASAPSVGGFDIRGGVLLSYSGNDEVLLNIPDYVVEIGENAFMNNLRLKRVKLPRGVRKIRRSAFRGCSALQSVTLSEGLEEIGEYAFFESGLRAIVVPSTVRSMSRAFINCAQLQHITFLDGITELPGGVCENCTSLTEVQLPATLKVLGGAFAGCTSLRAITLPEGLEKLIGGVFSRCTSLESIRVPASVKEASHGVFIGCTRLRHVEIADALARDDVFLEWKSFDSWDMRDGYTLTAKDSPWYADLYKKRQAAAKKAQDTQTAAWKAQGRCAYCGGSFTGFFSSKCSKCFRPKSY